MTCRRWPVNGTCSDMDLVQCRIVTHHVAGLAGFYASLLGAPAALNDYVEIQAGPASLGFSRRRFTEYPASGCLPLAASGGPRHDDIILDFLVEDVDAEYPRIAALGADLVMPPTTQPWGNRSMIFRDPVGTRSTSFPEGAVSHDRTRTGDGARPGPPAFQLAGRGFRAGPCGDCRR